MPYQNQWNCLKLDLNFFTIIHQKIAKKNDKKIKNRLWA